MRIRATRLLAPILALLIVGPVFGSGTLQWEDRFDSGGGDRAFSLATDLQHVYVAGRAQGPGGYIESNWMVRAYSTDTGQVIWTDQFDRAGLPDEAVAVAVDRGRVFAAGITTHATGSDLYVRAYDATTGAILWTDTYDHASREEYYNSLAAGNGVVIAVGGVLNLYGDEDIIIRAYSAATGARLWTRVINQGDHEEAFKVAIAGGRAFVAAAGNSGGCNLSWPTPPADFFSGDCGILVQAYDPSTGKLLWSRQTNIGGDLDIPFNLATNGRRVAVVGVGTPPGSTCVGFVQAGPARGNCDWLVQVYNAANGALIWEELYDRTTRGDFDHANSVAITGTTVFVSGFTAHPGGYCNYPDSGGNCDFTVRAYDLRFGGLLWDDTFDRAAGFDYASGLAVREGKVFAAGRAQANNEIYEYPTTVGNGPSMDWFVRAYDADTGVLLWQDLFDYAQGHDRTGPIAVQGSRVFAAGRSTNFQSNTDWLVRMYDW